MKSCFGYVRVSTVKQGEGVSLEAQRDAITAFAERSDIAITKWFEEKETAAKSGRPIFNGMIKLLRNRKVDGVVLHKPDRAARNFADWAKMGELADAGIEVHFASESLDFRSRGGRLSADIQAVIAADYIRNLKEEIRKGLDGRLKRGLYPFKAPIGYRDTGGGNVKTIDPVKGPMVKRVFELYATGEHSLRTLLIEMKRMGLRTDSNTVVSKGSLEAMFGNPFYTGIIRIKRSGAVYSGVHEPLIAPDLFERVQLVRSGKSGKKVTKHSHAYRGLFSCEHCNTAMIPELQKGHVYYRCHTAKCETKTVREEQIEQSILTVLSQANLTDENIAHLTSTLTTWIGERATRSHASTYKMQLEHLSLRLDRLTDALIDRLIDTDAFNTRKEALLMERAKLEAKLKVENETTSNPGHIQKFLELVKNLYSTYQIATKSEKRQIIKFTTSNRTVNGKKIYIETSNWLRDTQNALGVLLCVHDAPTSRSSPDMMNKQLDRLLEIAEEITEEKMKEELEAA